MDELAWEHGGLGFSATVYRYRVAGPWIVDVEAFGLSDTDVDDTEHTITEGWVPRWAQQDWITVTDGEVIDYEVTEDDFTADASLLRVADIS